MTATEPNSVQAAREAAERGELSDWVADFLASPGSDNATLGEKLSDRYQCWVGPLRLPLDELSRLAGSPDQPVLVEVHEDDWRDDVDEMKDLIESGWEPPPLVATWRQGQLYLEDGNHRAESIRRAGLVEAWTVVGFEDARARDQFDPPTLS
jgi:ParB-like nuclease domain